MVPQRVLGFVGAAIIKRENDSDENQVVTADNGIRIHISTDETGCSPKVVSYVQGYGRDADGLKEIVLEMPGGNQVLKRDKYNEAQHNYYITQAEPVSTPVCKYSNEYSHDDLLPENMGGVKRGKNLGKEYYISEGESSDNQETIHYSSKYRRGTHPLAPEVKDGGNHEITRDKNNQYRVYYSTGDTEVRHRDFRRHRREDDGVAEKMEEPGMALGDQRVKRDTNFETGYYAPYREGGDTIGLERYLAYRTDKGTDPLQDVKIAREMSSRNQRLTQDKNNDIEYVLHKKRSDILRTERYCRKYRNNAGESLIDVQEPAGANQMVDLHKNNEIRYRISHLEHDDKRFLTYPHKFIEDTENIVKDLKRSEWLGYGNQTGKRYKSTNETGYHSSRRKHEDSLERSTRTPPFGRDANDIAKYFGKPVPTADCHQREKWHKINENRHHSPEREREDGHKRFIHDHAVSRPYSRGSNDIAKYYEKDVRADRHRRHKNYGTEYRSSPRKREDNHGNSTHSRPFSRGTNDIDKYLEKPVRTAKREKRYKNYENECHSSRREREVGHKKFIHDHGYRKEIDDTVRHYEDHDWTADRNKREKRYKNNETVQHISRAVKEDFQKRFIHDHAQRRYVDLTRKDLEEPERIAGENQKKKRYKDYENGHERHKDYETGHQQHKDYETGHQRHKDCENGQERQKDYESRHHSLGKERAAKQRSIHCLKSNIDYIPKSSKELELSAADEIVKHNTYNTQYYFPGADPEVIFKPPLTSSKQKMMFTDTIAREIMTKKKKAENVNDNEIQIRISRDENGGTVTYSRKLNGVDDVDERKVRRDTNEQIGIHVSPVRDGKGTITYFRK
ncbi:hypothetical protein O3M35_006902 [Rhynocoris fuscipes]|uniref:Uncharacterized protein n=1 Tax=Rhynocoris fuscipes TaxID=488301 RepID=A0AAW1DMD1_9HEMI